MDEYVPAEVLAGMSVTDDSKDRALSFICGFLAGVFCTLVICAVMAFTL